MTPDGSNAKKDQISTFDKNVEADELIVTWPPLRSDQVDLPE